MCPCLQARKHQGRARMAWRRRRVPCLSRATCGDHSPVVRFRHAMAHRRPRQQDLHKRPGQRSDFAAAPKGSEDDDGVVWRSTLVSWVQGLLVLCFLFGSTAAAFFSRYFSFLHSPCVLPDEREHNG
ncbi:hypothetical protein PVAP13_4KG160071 [Panicum virgatum]|uniref:Uncharacterized protein n=1 Tax=Panicum virgatum TaxID=38727 RepID=A0A8T0TJS3_PANVG|nr:hypothetical protein PVAP13_4KG160071 [Panicum virgatum]